MSSEPVVFQGVTKSFAASEASALSQVQDVIARLKNGQFRRHLLKRQDRCVLDSISFSIAQGERVAILGANGAGKSTILKLVSRTLRPSSGKVSIRGSVGGLIELGAGFHGDLTGEDNVRFKLAFYGYSWAEAKAATANVFRLAGIENFARTPLKFYSSGMKVRLGFAVALAVSPDIVLLDEVLAVGDASFRERSMALVDEYLRDRTVLFVSHSMSSVRQVCSRTLVLHEGRLVFDGPAEEGITIHEDLMRGAPVVAPKEILAGPVLRGRADAPYLEVQELTLTSDAGQVATGFDKGERVTANIELRSPFQAEGTGLLTVNFRKILLARTSEVVASYQFRTDIVDKRGACRFSVSTAALLPGAYMVEVLPGLEGQPKGASTSVRRLEFAIVSDQAPAGAGLVDLDLMNESESTGRRAEAPRGDRRTESGASS